VLALGLFVYNLKENWLRRSPVLNSNYDVLEQILRLDVEAGAATLDWRNAQKQIEELAKKTKAMEEVIGKTRTDLAYAEGEARRQFKRIDELEERKSDRSARLFSAKNDDEHKALRREVDNVDRELRELLRRAEDSEGKIEQLKSTLQKAEIELNLSMEASAGERLKAAEGETKCAGRLQELSSLRETKLVNLDDRLRQHYERVAKLTRSPNGPITRVVDKACGNCRLTLAPQLLNNVLRGKDVESCPSCKHMLLPAVN
jgi:uncharacterized protein